MMAKSSEGDRPLNAQIGYNVMRARRRLGIAIPILAERAGVHKNTWNRAEEGYGVTAATLVKLARALDISLEELLPKSKYVVSFRARNKKAAKVVPVSAKLF
jgi:transcriptional regulator with XRE-family HTH domain